MRTLPKVAVRIDFKMSEGLLELIDQKAGDLQRIRPEPPNCVASLPITLQILAHFVRTAHPIAKKRIGFNPENQPVYLGPYCQARNVHGVALPPPL